MSGGDILSFKRDDVLVGVGVGWTSAAAHCVGVDGEDVLVGVGVGWTGWTAAVYFYISYLII